jgi:hypothetical protein
MLLLRPAIGVFAWYAYSAVQRQRLVRQGTFASMQMLSSFRQPDGDSLKLETLGQPVTAIADDWVYLTGRNPKLPTDSYRPTFRQTQHVACSFSNDGDTHGSRPHSSIALFGPRAVPLLSLRQLVTERMDLRPYVEEDLTKRLAWEHAMAECRPLLADENANSAAPLVPGAYSFLYRDYVNQEELLAMLCRRKAMETLLYRQTRATSLEVEDPTSNGNSSTSPSDQKCILTDRAKMLGFLPVTIHWEGIVPRTTGDDQKCTIRWTNTSCRIGWQRLGKTIQQPSLAEKYRKDDWDVLLPPSSDTDAVNEGDIIVFYRQGQGKLVFARDSLIVPPPPPCGCGDGHDHSHSHQHNN